MLQEALLALNEAVRIAQQHNDNVALAHALGALCHILAASAPSATRLLTDAAPAFDQTAAHLSQLMKVLRRWAFKLSVQLSKCQSFPKCLYVLRVDKLSVRCLCRCER